MTSTRSSASPGYKQTEVGVIREDWVEGSLSAVSKVPMQNGVFFKPSLKGVGVRLINVGDLYSRTPIDFSALELFDASDKERERFKVEDGDLFFTRSSVVPSGIAHCNIYRASTPGTVVFDSHVIRLRPDTKKVVPSFLFWSCIASIARHYFMSHAKTGTMTTIDQSVLGKCPVLLPSIAEQEAIAEALSDADALIESLEHLITKKRHLKQGAMQDLLTGKKRLPGFSGDWETKRLGSTATLKARIGWQGLTTAEYLDTGEIHLVTGTEFIDGAIDWSSCHYVDERRYGQDKNIQLMLNDVLVTKDGTIGKVALVTTLPGAATLNSGVFVIRPAEGAFYPEFFYYVLCSGVFTDFLKQLSAGSTINHLYQKDFVNFVYKTPSSITEQTAIAAILSDMDTEIAALEAKLAKTHQLKQGMMQELLTGKTRLV